MTPRIEELTENARQQIGKYIIVKNDKTGSFRTDRVCRINAVYGPKTATFDLVTENNYQKQYNAYTLVYESRKQAEDALQSLNERQRKHEEQQ